MSDDRINNHKWLTFRHIDAAHTAVGLDADIETLETAAWYADEADSVGASRVADRLRGAVREIRRMRPQYLPCPECDDRSHDWTCPSCGHDVDTHDPEAGCPAAPDHQ